MSGSSLRDGVYTVVPTPFTADGALDTVSLERLIRFLVGTGVEGLLVLGVLGEAPKLVPDERRSVIEVCLESAEDCPVVVGATHASVVGTRALVRAAEAAGAAAVMIAPPRVDRVAGDAAIIRYFAEVTAESDIEVVLQDHPASSGVTLSVPLIGEIAAAAPAVRSVKLEDPPTPTKVSQIRATLPDLKVYGGLGGVFFLEELRRGAHGTMTGFAFPELLCKIWLAHAAGDAAGATETFYRALPLIRFEFQEGVGLAIRKAAYVLRGVIADAHVRAPAAAPDPAALDELTALIAHLGLDGPGVDGHA